MFTRGGSGFGTGHLHRTQWLFEVLSAQPRLQGSIEVRCGATQTATAHFQRCGIAARFAADPIAAWLDDGQKSAGARQKPVCVIDWLDSTPEQVQALRAAGARIVLLDDYGPAQADADLVVNSLLAPLANAEQQLGRARVLSGADYVQLPPHAIRLRGISLALNAAWQTAGITAREAAAAPGEVRSLLISSGGGEPAGHTKLLLDALSRTGFAGQATVMPGAHASPLRSRRNRILVQELPAGPDFHDLLAGADLAILAGGLSLYEAAFLGVPALCIPIVAHQAATARKLARAGCCAVLPALLQATLMGEGEPTGNESEELAAQLKLLLDNAELRSRLSAAGMRTFDGKGLHRTVMAILELAGMHPG